jgi:hypothetical protein
MRCFAFVSKFTFFLIAISATLALAGVTVTVPINGSNVSTTVQYVASATTDCKAGVSAVGIYTAPGKLAYTTPGSSLNTLLTLSAGGPARLRSPSTSAAVAAEPESRLPRPPIIRPWHRPFNTSPPQPAVATRAFRQWAFTPRQESWFIPCKVRV